jgi:CRP-like cAMP-binding protein
MGENGGTLEFLQQMFPGMTEDDLVALSGVAEKRTYPEDTVLCREGEVEESFYAIVDGRVEVVKQMDDGTEDVLNRPGAGAFVGEIALVQKGARTATVRTTEPTTVLEIGHDDFIAMLERSGAMAVRVMLQITPRLREIDQAVIANLRERNAKLKKRLKKLKAGKRKKKRK